MTHEKQEVPVLLKTRSEILLLIIVFGLLLRLPTINVPLLDANAWRQAETASIARNFYEEEFNILYPRVNWRGISSGHFESDFQIYTFTIATLYKMFGVHDWLGRIVSLVFLVFATIFLFKLTHKIFDYNTAVWATLLFMISPLNIQFSRAFMPTSLQVFCQIASIYYFSRWMDEGTWNPYIAFAVVTTIAVLLKPQSLYLGLPLLYLAIKRYKKTAFLQWRMWLLVVIVILPALLWYNHAHQLFLETHLTVGIGEGGYNKFGGIRYWINPDFYKMIGFRVINDMLTFPGFVLATIGFFLESKKRNYVIYWWTLAFGIYVFIVAEGHYRHAYYQVLFIPIFCIYAGRGMSYLWEKDLFQDSFLKNRLSSKTALVLLFILMSIVCLMKSRQYLNYDPNRLEYGKRIAQVTKKNDLIIIGGWKTDTHLHVKYPNRDPIDFYFSNRKGWHITFDKWSVSLIESYRQQGARYFMTYYPKGFEINKTFAKEMRDKYKLLEANDRWIMYALE